MTAESDAVRDDYPGQVRQDHITGFWYAIGLDGRGLPGLHTTRDGAEMELVGVSS